MEIQVNTDNNVEGKQKLESYMIEAISQGLNRFGDLITRVEVHVSDENGNKKGPNDKRCLLEARLKGLAPVAVTSQEDSVHKAVSASIEKMKASLSTTVGKMKAH